MSCFVAWRQHVTLAEFHERVCELPLAQGEEKGRVTAVLLCFDIYTASLKGGPPFPPRICKDLQACKDLLRAGSTCGLREHIAWLVFGISKLFVFGAPHTDGHAHGLLFWPYLNADLRRRLCVPALLQTIMLA